MYENHSSTPERKHVRATLADISTIADDDIPAALRALDAATEGLLIRGMYSMLRGRGDKVSVCDLDLASCSESDIRKAALLAHNTMPHSRGGRHPTREIDARFALWLARTFQERTGQRPTVTTGGSTAFMRFAIRCFSLIGRRLREPAKLLRAATRQATGSPKRTARNARLSMPHSSRDLNDILMTVRSR